MGRWVRVAACAAVLALAACKDGDGISIGGDDGPETPKGPSASGEDTGNEEDVPFECAELPKDGVALSETEEAARTAYACTPVKLRGSVVDSTGAAVGGAQIMIGERRVTSREDGSFDFKALPRVNALLRVIADGMRTETRAVHLRVGLNVTELALPPVRIAAAEAGTVRMMFTGDFSLGRRFLDVDGSSARDELPPDDPLALIQVSDPEPGSLAVVEHVKPLFEHADFATVNLETAVTDNPATPHSSKAYAFFTLPGSLVALPELGVDYVSLGNNHVYDYLEQGLEDTLRHVDALGLGRSGAGGNADAAFVPWRTTLGGAQYSFLSMCSVAGDAQDLGYLATDTKGGAADLRDSTRISGTMQQERADGQIPIAILHSGSEYTDAPISSSRERMDFMVSQGAALVIAHHPHTPQGFAWNDGTFVAYSLGNFAFDQDRLETMVGMVAEVDLSGEVVTRAAAIPVYLEDYRPRPVAGALAERVLKRVGELSVPGGAHLTLEPGRAVVARSALVGTERTVTVEVDLPESGVALADLRALLLHGEYLARAVAPSGVELVPGEDTLLHGDFEDYDVDADLGEAARWELAPAFAYVCQADAWQGAGALCLPERAKTVYLHNRLRVPGHVGSSPNKDLSLVAYVRGENAGAIRFPVEFWSSEGSSAFGGATPIVVPAGSYDWQQVWADVHMPADPPGGHGWNSARALQLGIRQDWVEGTGLAAVDDVAVVAWRPGSRAASFEPGSINATEFLRVIGPAGRHAITVTLRR